MKIHGLTSAAGGKLNGKNGIAKVWDGAAGRWQVEYISITALGSRYREVVKLKPVNLARHD